MYTNFRFIISAHEHMYKISGTCVKFSGICSRKFSVYAAAVRNIIENLKFPVN